MNTRMTKYYDEEVTSSSSRFARNEELYKEIGKSNLENYDIKSNAVVIGENKNEIDVEKIKKILDTKYNEVPKRKSIKLEEIETLEEEKEITKEYDINVILEKAREQKSDNYEEERFKKLRDTQFDILKNLNINKNKEEKEEVEDDDLKSLINTITYNEKHNKEENLPLELLSDLKGEEGDEVIEGLKEEVKEENINEEESLTDSFYTSSNAIKEKDFEDEDIEEFAKSIESNNTFVKVIIAFIVIAFIVGIFLLVKTIYFK